MDLDIDTYELKGWWVVSVNGEVDVAGAPRLREAMIELIASGASQITINLEGADFIDSTGLGVLVGGLKRVRTIGGDLRLVCTNSRILKVFEITGLDSVFSIFDSPESATS